METLIKVAGNLRRHAKALDQLAAELEQSAPAPGMRARKAWVEEGVDTRVERLRHEAKLARHAVKRVEDALSRHRDEPDSGSERAAA